MCILPTTNFFFINSQKCMKTINKNLILGTLLYKNKYSYYIMIHHVLYFEIIMLPIGTYSISYISKYCMQIFDNLNTI